MTDTSTNPATAPTQRLATEADTPAEPKPGFKTTEFWLAAVATILGIALASGLVPEGGIVAQIIGGVLSVLANLGYTASRTQVKKG